MSKLPAYQETLLRRWIAGDLNRREEAELEALAREDELLSEALAGLRSQPEVDHGAALLRLRSRLQERRQPSGSAFAWRRLAAAAALLVIAVAAVWLWPQFGVNSAAEVADAVTETAETSTAPPAAAPERAAAEPRADIPVRTETARAATPVPRRERITAPPSASRVPSPTATTADEDLPVTSNVPAAVLPAAPPPPPPPPTSAVRDFAGQEKVAAGALEEDRSPVLLEAAPISAAPVPYSVGAKSIAPDTPNAVPGSEMEEMAVTQPRLAGAARLQGAARTVRGVVRNDDGAPLAGVMVTTPGVPAGLFTDSTGYFELRIDRTVDRLQFSNTGYADEEIAVEGADRYFEITLDEAVTESVSFDAAFAKTTIVPDDRPVMVSPPGGYRQLRRQLQTEKPAELPAGRVRLEFTVTESGELREFRVLETPDKRLSKWLIDRLRQTGSWTFYHGDGPHTVRYSVNFE